VSILDTPAIDRAKAITDDPVLQEKIARALADTEAAILQAVLERDLQNAAQN
jgi:hypothetical protein